MKYVNAVLTAVLLGSLGISGVALMFNIQDLALRGGIGMVLACGSVLFFSPRRA